MWNYEIALSQTLIDGRLDYAVNVFHINGKNLIQTLPNPDGAGMLNQNTGKVRNTGMEVQATFRIDKHWRVNADYSLLHMENPVLGAPEHKLSAGGSFSRGRWTLSTGLQYIAGLYTAVGPDHTEDFVLWNVRGQFRATGWLGLWLRGENLLAQEYEINAGYPMPRATVEAGRGHTLLMGRRLQITILTTKQYLSIMDTTVRLYSTGFDEARTYVAAALFVLGNIAVPQLFHLIPQGGVMWLPIYFFTLIGAYKYGWRVGLLTAILSPVLNSLLFGMPPLGALPAILLKSVLLAVCAGLAATHFRRATLWMLLLVVLSYQVMGTLGEWAMKGDLYLAMQDFRIGVPGMLMQILGGWAVINHVIRKY